MRRLFGIALALCLLPAGGGPTARRWADEQRGPVAARADRRLRQDAQHHARKLWRMVDQRRRLFPATRLHHQSRLPRQQSRRNRHTPGRFQPPPRCRPQCLARLRQRTRLGFPFPLVRIRSRFLRQLHRRPGETISGISPFASGRTPINGTVSASSNLAVNVYDLQATCSLQDAKWSHLLGIGLRYTQLSQGYQATLTNAATDIDLSSGHHFNGVGPLLAGNQTPNRRDRLRDLRPTQRHRPLRPKQRRRHGRQQRRPATIHARP